MSNANRSHITYWHFAVPCISSYEQQKRIKVVPFSDESTGDLLLEPESHAGAASRKRLAFARLRLREALSGADRKIPSYFPGHTIPSPGGPGLSDQYRGSLLFYQWRGLFEYDCGVPEWRHLQDWLNGNVCAGRQAAVEPVNESVWHWRQVRMPKLQYVRWQNQAEDRRWPTAEAELAGLATQAPRLQSSLYIRMLLRLTQELHRHGFERALAIVQKAWIDHETRAYADAAVDAAFDLFGSVRQELSRENLLPVLFELEAFASYSSLADVLNTFLIGLFGDNWLEIGVLRLSQVRPTEICVRERLLDEVCNLPHQRFAPIVVNEHLSVADGNHRLTSSWLWNLLKFCEHCDWSLEDEQLQSKVAQFCAEHSGRGMSPITVHEILGHLGGFLANPEQRSRLHSHIKPALKKYGYIDAVPVVLLPEYLSTTVVKEQYDLGTAVRRVPPSIYKLLNDDAGMVLPPRASYHFTDSALLPWFSVLPPAAVETVVQAPKLTLVGSPRG